MSKKLTSFSALALALALAVPLSAGAAVMTVVPKTAANEAVSVYVARPEGTGPFPAVLVLHGCTGFNGYDAIAADRLAARGYVGVAIDELGVRRPFGACESGGDGSREEAAAARATLAWLRTQPYVAADRLAVVGFSMGGNAVLDLVDPLAPGASAPPGLRAAVAFYPWCEGRDGNVNVPTRVFDGDADRITPSGPCKALAAAGKAAGKPVDITVYAGATHAFQVPGPDRTFFGETLHFDPIAAADSARQMDAFLAQYLKAS